MKINALLPEKYLILCIRGVHAATPIECLAKFCQPFFERGAPINVGIVPNIYDSSKLSNEWFDSALYTKMVKKDGHLSICSNKALVEYLKQNHAYEIVQNGCHHTCQDFSSQDQTIVTRCIEEGRSHIIESGLGAPQAFLAPYNQLSSTAFFEIAKNFSLISTAHYSADTVPRGWLPRYIWKQIFKKPHWCVGRTLLLSHVVCSLAANIPPAEVLELLKKSMAIQALNVINFHCWEMVHHKDAGGPLVDMLQRFADHIIDNVILKVIVFSELIDNPGFFKSLC